MINTLEKLKRENTNSKVSYWIMIVRFHKNFDISIYLFIHLFTSLSFIHQLLSSIIRQSPWKLKFQCKINVIKTIEKKNAVFTSACTKF